LERPVLYLDVDDTLVTFNKVVLERLAGENRGPWINGIHDVVAAPGAGDFLRWALDVFEVRWLTAWCPRGIMGTEDATRLGKALGVSVETLIAIRGIPWMHGLDKTTGIDWSEFRQGRPFVWVEDDLLPSELRTLDDMGALHCYRRCNVTEDIGALQKLHKALQNEYLHLK